MTSVGLGILTFNVFDHGREADLRETWRTTETEWCGHERERMLLTNGSTDGTDELVREMGGDVDNGSSVVGYGNNRLIEGLLENDLVVLSADDLSYKEGWLSDLIDFIEDAPESIALCSAYMEPIWEWNKPKRLVLYGGQRALVRESVPGSSWAFRSSDWDWMGPIDERPTGQGEDLEICARVAQNARQMAALDLSEHIGQERSAWGNQSHLTATPLDPAKWGL